jgi:transposase-like protein
VSEIRKGYPNSCETRNKGAPDATAICDDINFRKRVYGRLEVKRPVLVALDIRKDGKKEIIDFKLAPGESEKAWEAFLTDLYKRGLTED